MTEIPARRRRAAKPSPPAATKAEIAIALRLYVASATPNSERAKANLSATLRDLELAADFAIETIDVLADGRRAVADGVIVTPTLVAIGTKRRLALIGDLADRERLEAFLRSAAAVG